MKKSIIAIVALILLASCGGGGTATLKGTVKENKKKAPIEFAVIKVVDQETKTDRNGEFKLENLPTGKASILVSAEGYKPFEFGGYEIKDGENTIDEIFLEVDPKVVKDPDTNKIIEAPPLPGTPVKTKPAFKEFNDFTNCVVLLGIGVPTNGGSNTRMFKYYGNIIKMENPTPMAARDPNMPTPDVYYANGKMIINAGPKGWFATPMPTDPKNPGGATIDSPVKFNIDLIAKMLADKKSSLNYIGTVKGEYGEMKRYYLVGEDDNTNLVDGEIYVPTTGKYKDYVLKFSGRLLVGGYGDKTELSISQIGKVPPIELPSNIQEMPQPDMNQGAPKPVPPKNP